MGQLYELSMVTARAVPYSGEVVIRPAAKRYPVVEAVPGSKGRRVMVTTSDSATRPYSLAAGAGEAIWYVNNRATILATAAQTGGAFGLVHMEVAIGHGPPLHIHRAQDEAFWILEGQLTVRCGDEEFAAGPGAFVYTPRGVPHTFRLEGDAPAKLLVLLTPGGGRGLLPRRRSSCHRPGLAPARTARCRRPGDRRGALPPGVHRATAGIDTKGVNSDKVRTMPILCLRIGAPDQPQ